LLVFSLELASYYPWRLEFETRLTDFVKFVKLCTHTHTHTHTMLRAKRSGYRIPSARDFSPERPARLCGPPNLLFSVCRGSFPGPKQPAHDVDHYPVRSSVRVTVGTSLATAQVTWPMVQKSPFTLLYES